MPTKITSWEGFTATFDGGDRVSIIGENGVGKTTLLEIVVGEQDADSGEVHRSKDLRVGYLPQELLVDRSGTVLDEVMSGADHILALGRKLDDLMDAIASTTGPAPHTPATWRRTGGSATGAWSTTSPTSASTPPSWPAASPTTRPAS